LLCSTGKQFRPDGYAKGAVLDDNTLSSRRVRLVRDLLSYCIKYPDCKDTLDGIFKWWLHESQAGWTRTEVQQALDFLTAKGWLTTRGTAPAKTIYGLNRDHLEAIKIFCEDRVRKPG
jgi:hypothetical protein